MGGPIKPGDIILGKYGVTAVLGPAGWVLACAQLWGDSKRIESAFGSACAGYDAIPYNCQTWPLDLARARTPFSLR